MILQLIGLPCSGKSTVIKSLKPSYIKIDIRDRSITLEISNKELKDRLKNLPEFELKIKKGYLGRYARMVTSAHRGAVLE